jgi:hypothetical protein
MFAFVSALAATTYIFSVLIIGLFTVCAFDRPFTRELFGGTLRKYLGIVEVFSSGVTESAIHLILLKVFTIKLISIFGGFSKFVLCIIIIHVVDHFLKKTIYSLEFSIMRILSI